MLRFFPNRYLAVSSLSVFLGLSLISSAPAHGDDWPQWLGPKRDSIWREGGVVQSVPKDGLKVKWRLPIGQGYSSPSVVNGIVYLSDFIPDEDKTSDNPGATVKLGGTERMMAVDAKTGKVLWTHSYPEKYTISYPGGPRVAPTVVDGQIFSIGAQGRMTSLDAATGKVVWEKDLNKEFKTKPPQWGYASHPLVVGDKVFAAVGGEGSVAVAFDRKTGKEAWRALDAPEPGYCPPTLIEHQGKKQVLFWHAKSLNSLDPDTGKQLWSVPIAPDHGMAIAAPRQEGDLLFVSGAPRQTVVLKLKGDAAPEELWRGTGRGGLYAANATPFIDKGTVYGADALSGEYVGVNLYDGQRLWGTFAPTTGERRAPYGTAFTVKNEKNGHFYLFNEKGDLILADLTAAGYQEIGRQNLLTPTSVAFGREVTWSHPAYADKTIFVRNDKELVGFDLAKDSYPDGGPLKVVAAQQEEKKTATLQEAGTHVVNMSKFGLMAYYELMKDKEKAKQFTKNDLWTKVDVKTVHSDVFPSISFLYSYFPDNYAEAHMGKSAPKPTGGLPSLSALFGSGNAKNIKEWTKSEAFLDHLDGVLSRLESEYRKVRASAKVIDGPKDSDFMPTKEKFFPARTDKDAELWRIYSEIASLEYFLYKVTGIDIDLASKYKEEVSVRVRDPNSKKTLSDYFGFSKNPKRAIDIARRMARMEKDHLTLYGQYTPMRELLIRFLSYHWEFHDLLLPELNKGPDGEPMKIAETHSAVDK